MADNISVASEEIPAQATTPLRRRMHEARRAARTRTAYSFDTHPSDTNLRSLTIPRRRQSAAVGSSQRAHLLAEHSHLKLAVAGLPAIQGLDGQNHAIGLACFRFPS